MLSGDGGSRGLGWDAAVAVDLRQLGLVGPDARSLFATSLLGGSTPSGAARPGRSHLGPCGNAMASLQVERFRLRHTARACDRARGAQAREEQRKHRRHCLGTFAPSRCSPAKGCLQGVECRGVWDSNICRDHSWRSITKPSTKTAHPQRAPVASQQSTCQQVQMLQHAQGQECKAKG